MAAMLRSRLISAFPVVDDADRVVGVVSEGDLLVKEAVHADGTSLLAAFRHHREDDKATGIAIGPDGPVAEAARVMYDRRVKRPPATTITGQQRRPTPGSEAARRRGAVAEQDPRNPAAPGHVDQGGNDTPGMLSTAAGIACASASRAAPAARPATCARPAARSGGSPWR
jgi:hypothetical protein